MKRDPIEWQKRNVRCDVSLVGLARSARSGDQTVTVTNLSYEGCQIAPEHDVQIGELMTLELTGVGPIQAQVRWTIGGKAGLRFLPDKSVETLQADLSEWL